MTNWRWIIYPWALMEDLSGLIEGMEARLDEPAAIVEGLRREHGIRVSRQAIMDALATMERVSSTKPISLRES